MKYFYLLFLLAMVGCNKETKNILPKQHLTTNEQELFKYKIVRYIERLAKYATDENKFESKFDEEYKQMAKNCNLIFYYKDNENNIYFAISKIAPSVKLKKTATVGKLKYNEKDSIILYEEVFRTWKMEPNELTKKTHLLFSKLINNMDLSSYYTKNSKPDFYIEFPDETTYYDTVNRKWKIK